MSDENTYFAGRSIVILGALSGVAEATARQLAGLGANIALMGRQEERLNQVADDLKVRGAPNVSVHVLDLVEAQNKTQCLEEIQTALGGLDDIMIFYGVLGDQETAIKDPTELKRIVDTNFTSATDWIISALPFLDASKAPTPTVLSVSSVAGDRGRASNFVYGSAKGALSTFMQGLSHQFAAGDKRRSVSVKMGFVRTAMTAHLKTSGPLWAEPSAAAETIVKAMQKGGPIVYAPFFWRYIMLAIRMTPDVIFNKVRL
ncbi:MAG: SDR family NAD(P)-dependent oxidoreductase [Pseudomonadota bacterium]